MHVTAPASTEQAGKLRPLPVGKQLVAAPGSCFGAGYARPVHAKTRAGLTGSTSLVCGTHCLGRDVLAGRALEHPEMFEPPPAR